MVFPGMNTKSGANTYKQGLVVPTRASEAEFFKGYNSTGKSYANSPGYIQQPTTVSMAGQVGSGWDGTYSQPTGLSNIQNRFNKYTGRGNYIDANGVMTGGLGTEGSYTYAPSISSETGALIPGGTIGLDQGASSAMQGQTGFTAGGGGFSAGDIASGIGAAAGLANAYIGYKNYGLTKDKFGFEKAATNRNVANQAQQYNAELQNRADIGLALGGSAISPEQRAATLAQVERQRISGDAIG